MGWIKGKPLKFIRGHQSISCTPIVDAIPFKIDGVYCRLIPLTKGQYAIVDAADYEWLCRYKWHAYYDRSTKGYYVRSSRCGSMHRVILGLTEGDIREGDHANGIGLDNRRGNLRTATHRQNLSNRTILPNKIHGRYKGTHKLYWSGKWEARIMTNGKILSLGTFVEEKDAAMAYDNAAIKLHGTFARLNFPIRAEIV